MRSTRLAGWLAALLFAIAPALFAYTVVLHDGTVLEATRKYSLRPDGKAVVSLTDGTTRLLDVSAIDVKKTEQVNRAADESVVVLEARRGTTPDRGQKPKTTLEDMHRAGARASELERPPTQRTTPLPSPPLEPGAEARSSSRRPFSNRALASELEAAFRANGVSSVSIYQGSDGRRPRVEIATANEAAVFQAIEAAAHSLISVRQSSTESLSTLELSLATPGGERAGQFLITPEQAKDLTDGKLDTVRFFVKYVQF